MTDPEVKVIQITDPHTYDKFKSGDTVFMRVTVSECSPNAPKYEISRRAWIPNNSRDSIGTSSGWLGRTNDREAFALGMWEIDWMKFISKEVTQMQLCKLSD